MKVFICSISVFCLSFVNAQKPPLTNDKFYCNAVVGIDDSEILTDKDGISLEYSSDTSCNIYYKGKLFTGKIKTCKNNKIFRVISYVNGRLEGENYSYFDNGNLAYYKVYGKDTTEGEWVLETQRDEKGVVLGFKKVKDCSGVENGEDLAYHENGKLMWKRFILNGKREGKWYFYDEKGALMEIKSFKDDKEDGEWIFYDAKGAVMTIRIYKEGEEISCSGRCE
jgi:antitoxin component YwqK of YwqJK toxin-antitoxin module